MLPGGAFSSFGGGALAGPGGLAGLAALAARAWGPPGASGSAGASASGSASTSTSAPTSTSTSASAPAQPARAPAARPFPSACGACGGRLARAPCGGEAACECCGLVVRGDPAALGPEDGPRAPPATGRLHLVGPGAGQLRPDLYRSSPGDSSAAQQKAIRSEYLAFSARFVAAGGPGVSRDAIEAATARYNTIQKAGVWRGTNKKAIMAYCLYEAFHATRSFVLSKADTAAFMELTIAGFARGENLVRALVADGAVPPPEEEVDLCMPKVTTLFARTGFEGEAFAFLHAAAAEVVRLASAHHIGVSSILSSKVAGAVFAVLSRCRDPDLVPAPPSLGAFCERACIRKNTVERVLDELDAFHSFFAPAYRAAGLDPARVPAPRPAPPAAPRRPPRASAPAPSAAGAAASAPPAALAPAPRRPAPSAPSAAPAPSAQAAPAAPAPRRPPPRPTSAAGDTAPSAAGF